QERRAEEDVRGRRDPEQSRQSRRRDRRVRQGGGDERQLLRLLLQHRVLRDAKEGLRQGGGGVQESDRAQSRLRRGVQRPREHLQRAAQVRSGGGGEREGDGTLEHARRERRRRRQRRRDVQPGRDSLERGKDRRGEEAVRERGRREPEPRGSALPARHGAGERRQPRRRRDRVRDVPEDRTDGAERRDGEEHPRVAAEEVVIDVPALRARSAGVRDRIARAARRAGRDPSSITLVAVSKTFPVEYVRAAAEGGQTDFGENKVQEALQKIPQTLDLPVRWHLVGHL